MKKLYITPVSEIVRLKIKDSILEDNLPVNLGSRGANPGDSFGKENNFDFDDDAFGDIWGSEDDNTKNLWGDN